jgi:hypothetical protein
MIRSMSDYLEAIVSLYPREAGGRALPVAPREGSYRPFARAGEAVLRLRFIEGPPLLGPGDAGRVVAELEPGSWDDELVAAGAELDLCELGGRVVGIVSVLRRLR